MTIYDAPIDDTVFFPVSGDMMRQMKHDEDQRLKKENDPGDPAKNHTEAESSNPQQGERTINRNSTTEPMFGAHTISMPFVVTCFANDRYAILDVYKRVYVVVGLRDRDDARAAAKALNNCYCEFDEDGRLIAIYGRRLRHPRKVIGEE